MHRLILTFPSLLMLFPPHSPPLQCLANLLHFFLQQHHLLHPPQKLCTSLGPFNVDCCQKTNQFQHTNLRKETSHLHVALHHYHPRSHPHPPKSTRHSSSLVQDLICWSCTVFSIVHVHQGPLGHLGHRCWSPYHQGWWGPHSSVYTGSSPTPPDPIIPAVPSSCFGISWPRTSFCLPGNNISIMKAYECELALLHVLDFVQYVMTLCFVEFYLNVDKRCTAVVGVLGGRKSRGEPKWLMLRFDTVTFGFRKLSLSWLVLHGHHSSGWHVECLKIAEALDFALEQQAAPLQLIFLSGSELIRFSWVPNNSMSVE